MRDGEGIRKNIGPGYVPLQAVIRRQILRDVDGLAVGPQVLQIVIGAGIGHKHMHDDVRVVQQDPVLGVEALGADGLDALLGKRELTSSASDPTCVVEVPEAMTK